MWVLKPSSKEPDILPIVVAGGVAVAGLAVVLYLVGRGH